MRAEGITPEHDAASLVAAPTFSHDAVEAQPETLVTGNSGDFQASELGVTSPAKIEAVMQPPPSPPLLQGFTVLSPRIHSFLLLAFITVLICFVYAS